MDFIYRFRLGLATFKYINITYYQLELELIQTQMTQKPMLRAEVYATSSHRHIMEQLTLARDDARAVDAASRIDASNVMKR